MYYITILTTIPTIKLMKQPSWVLAQSLLAVVLISIQVKLSYTVSHSINRKDHH